MKKKFLLLSDNVFSNTGIGTMSKEIIYKTIADVDWVQLAGASTDNIGNKVDHSLHLRSELKVEDAYFVQYPVPDYGNEYILRYILDTEKPDAIIHFTDPRFWLWLYAIEYELHQAYNIPISYYSIWDNYPIPLFNKPYYESCDQLLGISKLSDEVHRSLVADSDFKIDTRYIPHGVDPDVFNVITPESDVYSDYILVSDDFKSRHHCKYIFFWNNVNIDRKRPIDMMQAFKVFCDKDPEYKKDACLVLHTQLITDVGADLLTVKRQLYDDYNITFSTEKVPSILMNFYYNMSVATINIAFNEGFGLSNLEALMAGCIAITNQTGGLKDQSITSMTIPVYPKVKTLSGKGLTPYIYRDYADINDIADAIEAALIKYKKGISSEEIQEARNTLIANKFTSNDMAQSIKEALTYISENFINRPKYKALKLS